MITVRNLDDVLTEVRVRIDTRDRNPLYEEALTLEELEPGTEFVSYHRWIGRLERNTLESEPGMEILVEKGYLENPTVVVFIKGVVCGLEAILSDYGICRDWKGDWHKDKFCVLASKAQIRRFAARLVEEGNPDAAEDLREMYPEFFTSFWRRLADRLI
jgi:hypothetical protein